MNIAYYGHINLCLDYKFTRYIPIFCTVVMQILSLRKIANFNLIYLISLIHRKHLYSLYRQNDRYFDNLFRKSFKVFCTGSIDKEILTDIICA